jgi:hypothetical protein
LILYHLELTAIVPSSSPFLSRIADSIPSIAAYYDQTKHLNPTSKNCSFGIAIQNQGSWVEITMFYLHENNISSYAELSIDTSDVLILFTVS